MTVAADGGLLSWPQPERDLAPGTGLALWRGARLRLAAWPLRTSSSRTSASSSLFFAELHEQLDVELCQPNRALSFRRRSRSP